MREGRPLRGILAAGGAHGGGAGSDEDEVRRFERFNQCLVLRHEAVAGEHRVVAVLAGDADDLGNARLAFLAVRSRVVANTVHRLPIPHGSEFWRPGVRMRHGILVRKQDAVAVDPHRLEDVHRLLAHRTATDDQRFEIGAVERLDPRGFLPAAGGRARFPGAHQWNSLCGPAIGPGL